MPYIPGPSSLGAKWFRYRVSIPHPLGFNWDPLEWCWYNYIISYIYIYILYVLHIYNYIYIIKLYHPSLSLPYFPPHWTWQMTCTFIHLSCSKNCDANFGHKVAMFLTTICVQLATSTELDPFFCVETAVICSKVGEALWPIHQT